MRNISLLVNLILVVIMIVWGCSGNSGNSANSGNSGKVSAAPSPECVTCKSYPTPSDNVISALTAKTMAEKYQRENLPNLRISNSSDAACIWFSLESVKAFIWQMEQSTCASQCKPYLGIRIYYAKYPDKMSTMTDLAGLPSEYARHHTVFMVATVRDSVARVNYDFDPLNVGRNICKPQPFNVDNLTSKPAAILAAGVGGDDETARNHGDLIPPRTPSGTAFYH